MTDNVADELQDLYRRYPEPLALLSWVKSHPDTAAQILDRVADNSDPDTMGRALFQPGERGGLWDFCFHPGWPGFIRRLPPGIAVSWAAALEENSAYAPHVTAHLTKEQWIGGAEMASHISDVSIEDLGAGLFHSFLFNAEDLLDANQGHDTNADPSEVFDLLTATTRWAQATGIRIRTLTTQEEAHNLPAVLDELAELFIHDIAWLDALFEFRNYWG